MESVIIMAKRAKKSIGLLGIVCELSHRVLEQGSVTVVHIGIMTQIFSVGILSKVVRKFRDLVRILILWVAFSSFFYTLKLNSHR